MTTIEDSYSLTTKADVGPLVAAQSTIRQQFAGMGPQLQALAARATMAASSFRQFVTSRVTANGLAMALRNVGAAAASGALGLGRMVFGTGGLIQRGAAAIGVLRGFATQLMGLAMPLMLLGGLFVRAIGGIGKLTNSAASGGGAAKELAEGMDEMGASAERTSSKVQGVLGAFGEVGAGFVQSQGRAAREVETQGDVAVKTAQKQVTASATGEQAASRLGKAWERIAEIFREAFGRVLLPALDALATMMEDPRFLEFVTLLADDLAGALQVVVGWLIDEAIPAVLDWMDQVNEAGGPVEWLMGKWEELRDTLLRIVAIILGKLVEFTTFIRLKFYELMGTISLVWGALSSKAMLAFSSVEVFAAKMWENIKGIFQIGINALIGGLNALIKGYNNIGGGFGLPAIGEIPGVSLAKGGIVGSPTLAVVGDNPDSREVVAPLDDLAAILEGMGVGGGGSVVVENLVVQVPSGVTNPRATGEAFGLGVIEGLSNLSRVRRAGVRMP